MFRVTYDIACDHCPSWIGEGCRSKTEVKELAINKGWRITGRHHECPTCRETRNTQKE